MSKEKDIYYKIVIPVDGSVDGRTVLEDPDLKVREGGFCGEKLIFWLVATWQEDAAYLGKFDWNSNVFKAELTNLVSENYPSHISSSEIQHIEQKSETVLQNSQAAIPFSISLPAHPLTSADLIIWKGEYSTKVITESITVSLPIVFQSSLSVIDDNICISLDFANSETEINSHNLKFIPRKISLADYESAFALQKRPNNQYFLRFTSRDSILLLQGLVLSLTVFWNHNTMVSTFSLDISIPANNICFLWECPQLERLKQTSLYCEVTNKNPFDVKNCSVEMEEDVLIPLIKTVNLETLHPNQQVLLEIPIVPIKVGVFSLNYKVKLGNFVFKPLFQTPIKIV